MLTYSLIVVVKKTDNKVDLVGYNSGILGQASFDNLIVYKYTCKDINILKLEFPHNFS